MTPLGIGLAGIGRWGRNYLRTLSELPDCRLAAVADVSADARRSTFVPCPVLRTLEDLLAVPSVEAVVIATPDRTHAPLALEALRAGRHVLVEKPAAADTAAAQELLAEADRRGLVLAVGHTMLYHPGFAALQQAVAAGALGRVSALAARRTSAGPAAPADVLWDLAPHDVAMAIVLMGEPVAVRVTDTAPGRVGYELLFPGDVAMAGSAAWDSGSRVRRFEVTGSAGSKTFTDENADRADAPQPLALLCRDFIACCRSGAAPASDGRLGVAVTRCLAALAASALRPGAWSSLSPRSPARGAQPIPAP